MKKPLLNLVLSDTHFGSDVALLPPSVELSDGSTVGHGKNRKQKWLWESFADMQKRALDVIGKEPFALTLNGDLIEGIHHRSDEVVAAKMAEHLTIAVACLGELARKAAVVYVVRGTDCHTRDLEGILLKDLGLPGKAQDVWQYRINGCLVDARHHMPATSRAYLEASAMSIILGNARVNMTRANHEVPKVFLRGHRHCTGDYCDGDAMFVVTGPWQLLTRHGHKVVTESITRPSAYLLDWRGTKPGALPATHRFVYTPPANIVTQ